MKKTFSLFFILALLLTVSCKKNSASQNYWTFKGTTYLTNICVNNDSGVLTGFSTVRAKAGSSYDTIFVLFPSYQPPSGTYTVANYNTVSLGPTQIGIAVVTGDSAMTTYYSSGEGNTPVSVTISSAGLLSVSGPGIIMQNANLASDTSRLSLDLGQTQ